MTCSYLTEVKRLSLLIKALAICKSPITWTHLGGGALLAQLTEQAQNSLPSNILWRFTGVLDNQEILEFYQREPADVFINMSSSEGLPVSIMEAMSYGIPVMATNVGGTAELVNADNGFLWSATVTPENIAQTIKDFHDLPMYQKRLKRQAAFQTWRNVVNAESQYTYFTSWIIDTINQKLLRNGKD